MSVLPKPITHRTIQKNIRQERYPAKCLLEDIRQSNKYQRRTGIGLNANRKCRRENNDTCQYCNKCVDDSYTQRRIPQLCLFSKIRGISGETSHPQAQGEKGLSHGTQNTSPVTLLKSGFNRNSNPFSAFGKDNEHTASRIIRIKVPASKS